MSQINFEKFDVIQDEKKITFSCASDYPYVRYDEESDKEYEQILIVDQNAVDMSRLNTGNAPLLFNHNADKLLGIVNKAYIIENKIYVQVQFSKNDQFADRIYKDILDGTLKGISIGYQIVDYDDVQQNGINKRYVTKYMIYEVSCVSIPADPKVGIRQLQIKDLNNMKKQCSDDLEKKEMIEEEVVEKEQIKEQVKEEIKEDKLSALEAENQALKAEIEALKADKKEQIKEEIIEQKIEDKEQIVDDETKQQIEKIGEDFNVEKEQIERAIQNKLTVRQFKQTIKNKNINIINKKENSMENSTREFGQYLKARNYEKPFCLRTFTGFGGKTSENGAALIGTETIDYVPALTKIMGVRGFRTLNNLHYNISIPVQSGRNTVYQTDDLRTAATTSNPTFTNVTMSPVKLSGNTVIGTELIVQSNTDIVGFIIDSLSKEIAYKLQDFILGKVVSAQPTEVNYSSLSAITWDDVLAFESAVGGYALTDLQFVGSPSARAALKGIPKASNYPDFLCSADNKVNGYDFNVSGCVSNDNLYFGDFSKMVVGFFGQGLDILVNPYKYSTQGMIEVTASICVDAVVTQKDAFALGKVQASSSDSSESSSSI